METRKDKSDLTHDANGRPNSIDGKVNLILDILQGNPFDKNDDGLMGSLVDARTRLKKLEDWKNRTVAWAIGASFGGGAFVAYIIQVLLFKNKP